MVFNEVQTDLEAQGYEVQPYVLPAASVGAPHRRDRVWFVAYSTGEQSERVRLKFREFGKQEQEQFRGNCGEVGSERDAADTEHSGFQRQYRQWEGCSEHRVNERVFIGSENKFNAADTGNEGLQRGEVIGGIGGIGQNGNKFPSGCIPPNWDIFPTQSPVRGRDDGIPNRLDGITFPKWRNESIKAYGNAVVPQVVYQIFKAIQEYETI
jgi:DNA (cytosine-5)-methyltransferase 1